MLVPGDGLAQVGIHPPLGTGPAPSKTACPAHIAVQGYLKLAAQGKYQEALALIRKDNPLPAVTYCEGCGREYPTVEYGRICPHCGSEKTWLLRGNELNIKEITAASGR